MNNHQLSEPEQIQLLLRLQEALKMAQLLKIRSLTDWSQLVSRHSEKTGERVEVRFEVDANHSVTGMYYVMPERSIEIDPEQPSPLNQALVYLSEQSEDSLEYGKGFMLDDFSWGRTLAQKIEQGETLSPETAQAALERIRKYTRQLAKADIQLPRWEEIAYHYDPNTKPVAIVEGNTLDSPITHPQHLRSAFKQQLEPLETSVLLLQSGEFLAQISHHFRSSNGGLDGFDLLQAGTGLVGAGLVVLGRLNEHFRRQTANQLTKSDQSLTREIGGVAKDLDNCKNQALQILSARGQELPDVPESKLNLSANLEDGLGDRYELVQWINFLDAHQRSLLTSLDEERQPKPINLTQSDEPSLKEAITSLKERQKDLKELVSRLYKQEKPIEIIGGAISPENLYQRVETFFWAREEASERVFNQNSSQGYSTTNEDGVTLHWHKSGLIVHNKGHQSFHLQKTEGGFQTSGSVDVNLTTRLSQLPQKVADLKKIHLSAKLLQGLRNLRQYHHRSGEFNLTKHGESWLTFKFSQGEQDTLIRGFDKDGAEIWRSQQQVEVNNFDLPVLAQLSQKLARPTKTKTHSREVKREVNQQKHLTLTV